MGANKWWDIVSVSKNFIKIRLDIKTKNVMNLSRTQRIKITKKFLTHYRRNQIYCLFRIKYLHKHKQKHKTKIWLN